MKKVLLVLAATFLLASFVSSCKVVDPCPAYNNANNSSEGYEQLN